MDGWVQLHRKSMTSQAYQDDLTWKIWTECLLRAAYADRFVSVQVGRGMTTVELKRGQLIYGRNKWAKRLGRKPSSVDRRMKQLATWGNVDIQAGTHYSIVTVCGYEAYNPRETVSEQPSEQPADNQPKERKERKERKEPKERKERKERKEAKKHLGSDPSDLATATWILDRLRIANPGHKQPNLKAWANTIRLIREQDKRTDAEIRELFQWAHEDEFWGANILCPKTLRKQWDKLAMRRKSDNQPKGGKDGTVVVGDSRFS